MFKKRTISQHNNIEFNNYLYTTGFMAIIKSGRFHIQLLAQGLKSPDGLGIV